MIMEAVLEYHNSNSYLIMVVYTSKGNTSSIVDSTGEHNVLKIAYPCSSTFRSSYFIVWYTTRVSLDVYCSF